MSDFADIGRTAMRKAEKAERGMVALAREADAAIAQRDELLSALEEARDLLLRFVGGEPGTQSTFDRVNAAIAKARGK